MMSPVIDIEAAHYNEKTLLQGTPFAGKGIPRRTS